MPQPAQQPARHLAPPASDSTDRRPERYSGSLDRGLALLRCFTPEQPTLGIAELADLTGQSRSTTHRYASTLVVLGWLEQPSGAGRKYRLGREAQSLGIAAIRCFGLGEVARPWLAELRARTGMSVALGVLDGDEVLYVAWLPSRACGQAGFAADRRVGWCVPVLSSAAGVALLSFMSEEDWPVGTRARLAGGSAAGRRLCGEIEEASERKYAMVCAGSARDRRCGVAAVVLGASEPIAAVELVVFGEAARGVDLRRRFAGAVCRAAEGLREQVEEDSRPV